MGVTQSQGSAQRAHATELGSQVAELAAWRRGVTDALSRYIRWCAENDLDDAGLQVQTRQLLKRLKDPRMTVAFVAEFSRGKSELINAMFFSRYGRRIVPSSAGRTTMCPTELLHDPHHRPSIRLLPIETRLRDTSLAELRESPEDWRETPIDPDDAASLAAAFDAVRQTRQVTLSEAQMLGLSDPVSSMSPPEAGAQAFNQGVVQAADQAADQVLVEIPRWRHAIVNLPDPLLAQGLVLIDTPGLNAIGNEPELTLNLIPSCDAVVFVLAADTGVTRSDIEVWKNHISQGHGASCLVVLNKIDGLWDELRRPAEIDLEIARQVSSVARHLAISVDRVHAVSAQKALVARIRRDDSLLWRSRIASFEQALSAQLIAGRRQIIAEQIERGLTEVDAVASAVLSARQRHLGEQQLELEGLRGKNRGAVEQMVRRVRDERRQFETSLRRLHALRAVYRRNAEDALAVVAVEQLRGHVRAARELMRASKLSIGLRAGMERLNVDVRRDFEQLRRQAADICTLMTTMYKSFASEHGLALDLPQAFAVDLLLDDLEQIDSVYRRQFGAISLVTTEKYALMRRFFESVASRLKNLYERAGRELDAWLRSLLSPIEAQIREQQQQLQRRLDAVRRVMSAADGLQQRITELEQAKDDARRAIEAHAAALEGIRQALASHPAESADSDPRPDLRPTLVEPDELATEQLIPQEAAPNRDRPDQALPLRAPLTEAAPPSEAMWPGVEPAAQAPMPTVMAITSAPGPSSSPPIAPEEVLSSAERADLSGPSDIDEQLEQAARQAQAFVAAQAPGAESLERGSSGASGGQSASESDAVSRQAQAAALSLSADL